MRYNQMTLAEVLAWKSGDFEEYKALITRMHWLESHIRGAGERMLDAEDSMSVFNEDEHEDAQFLKYKTAYETAKGKTEKWTAELLEVEKQLTPYMIKGGQGKMVFR